MLRQISLNEDPSRIIDSGVLLNSRDSLVFELPLSSDSLYQLSLKFSRIKLYLIPENPYIRIIMNTKTGKNSVAGSPASISVLRFNEEQDSLMYSANLIQRAFKDSQNRMKSQEQDSIQRINSAIYKNIQQRYYNFADSISSSAAFMEDYDYIDFGSDYVRMKDLVSKAAVRFPNSSSIRRLKTQVLNLGHIYEKELKPGDIFPDLRLPDLDGRIYSTTESKGKYIFIDFWSSWCRNCATYFKIKKKLADDRRFQSLVLISIAMDNNQKFCKETVKLNQLHGIQLIDREIWQGQTSSKLAFDSIPFNFLVAPDHRILAKAIPADSVIPALKKYFR